MWNQLSPQQQQYLMAMLMGGHGAIGQPAGGMPAGMPQGQPVPGQYGPPMAAANQQLGAAQQPAMPMNAQLGNPLMTGGNSAVNPQQQAQMMQYLQMLQSPQGFGATANGNIPVWQMLMGRSPTYGTGGAVP